MNDPQALGSAVPTQTSAPVRAFLIEEPLAARLELASLPACLNWEHDGLRRFNPWNDNRLLSGDVAQWHARLLEAKVQPVIVVRMEARGDDWARSFESIPSKSVMAVHEFDPDAIAGLRDELCGIDAAVLGAWGAFLRYRTLGMRVLRNVPSQAFWNDYGRALARHVTSEEGLHRLRERSPWALEAPSRDVSTGEFGFELGQDDVGRLTSEALPFCLVEASGWIPTGNAVLSGFFALPSVATLVTELFNRKRDDVHEQATATLAELLDRISDQRATANTNMEPDVRQSRFTLLREGRFLWELTLRIERDQEGLLVDGTLLTRPDCTAQKLLLHFGPEASVSLVSGPRSDEPDAAICKVVPHLGRRAAWHFALTPQKFVSLLGGARHRSDFWVEEVE